jgi:hypothetical protein
LVRRRLTLLLAVVTPLGFASKLYAGPGQQWVRYHAGGVVYEVFWILLVLLVRPRLSPWRVAGAVLLVTCALELLQLWNPPVLAAVRASFLGHALIGSSFSWWDFPHYLLGCLLGGALAVALRPAPASSG